MIDVIIVPQGAEYKAVKQGLARLKIARPLIISIPIGVDRIAETLTCQQFWETQPKRVLMMGLCGSLSARYSVGDAVLYRDCYSQATAENLVTNESLNRVINQKIKQQFNQNISLVSGIMSDRIITNVAEKKQLAQNFTASVVDMESFAYLKLLQQKGVAVSILRIVSDDLKYNLPNLDEAISDRGKIKPLIMAGKMLKQPTASLRLIKSSLQALQRLQEIAIDLLDLNQ
jgi:nucleoside phosphorylase